MSLDIKGREEYCWAPGGDAIAYSKTTDGVDNIWHQPLDGSEPTQITHFDKDWLFSVRWSPDGKELAVSHGRTTRDVILIKNFR